jgi:hypothetical protein
VFNEAQLISCSPSAVHITKHNTHLTDADDETLSSPAESTSQAHKQRLKDKIITVNTYFVFKKKSPRKNR